MISSPASSRCPIALARTRRSPSAGLVDRHQPEEVIVFTGIRSRRALPAGIRTYKGIRNILENKLDQVERDQPPATPLPAHANIRGEGYYN